MWKLTIEDDEGKQTALPLAHDEYGVGRAEANAIRLTDRNVSRKHALIKKNGQGWVLSDLQSYNGTYVNGNRVAGEQHLGNGDVVQLGDYRLELIDEALAPALVAGADAPTPGTVPMSPVHQRPDRLVVVVGPTPGAEFPLNREHFTIGRAEDANISINHASISRLHAELMAIGNGRYEIVDKQSANGIRINGVELKRGILEAGDALELGDVRMRFVGAGKIFRAGADQSQQLLAVGGESMPPSVRAPSLSGMEQPRGGIGRIIGVGVAVGLVVVVGIIAIAMKSPASPTPGTGKSAVVLTPDAANQIIADAKAAAAKGDLDGAHEKIKSIPDGSVVLADPAIADMEGKWADMMFGKVDQATDPADKRKLLNVISTSPNVDAERRKKAVDQLSAIDAATPDPQVPRVPLPYNPGGAIAGTSGGLPAPTAKTAEPVTTVVAPPNPGAPALSDYDAQRRRLEPKVWSGKATEEEIRLLKAMCSHMGDRACRDRASAMLKKKQEQSGN